MCAIWFHLYLMEGPTIRNQDRRNLGGGGQGGISNWEGAWKA